MARRFRFRFETMLKIRQQREEQRKRVVGERLGQIGSVQHQIEALHRQIGDEEGAIRSAGRPGTIDIQQVVRHRHWLGHLHRSLLDTEARKRGLEAQLAQDRAALAEAAKQRRILEKLKERQWRRFRQEADALETREADELSTIRFVFNRSAANAAVQV